MLNQYGGKAVATDFCLSLNDTNNTAPFSGDSNGTQFTFLQGLQYSVSEVACADPDTSPSGYKASYSAECTGEIVALTDKLCTVTNTQQSQAQTGLTLRKNVVNDNGGTAASADWTLSANLKAGSPAACTLTGFSLLDLAAGVARDDDPGATAISGETVEQVGAGGWRRFDRGGDIFHDQISALHKSVRGSDPDAALYWFARMLDGGCDPRYIARRVVRMAVEDIGLADPRAFSMTLEAWEAYERLGTPEGELALAQAIVFLACAAKSNAVYTAFSQAQSDATEFGSLEVPLHIRNEPTRLMKDLGHGKGYRYAPQCSLST